MSQAQKIIPNRSPLPFGPSSPLSPAALVCFMLMLLTLRLLQRLKMFARLKYSIAFSYPSEALSKSIVTVSVFVQCLLPSFSKA